MYNFVWLLFPVLKKINHSSVKYLLRKRFYKVQLYNCYRYTLYSDAPGPSRSMQESWYYWITFSFVCSPGTLYPQSIKERLWQLYNKLIKSLLVKYVNHYNHLSYMYVCIFYFIWMPLGQVPNKPKSEDVNMKGLVLKESKDTSLLW